MLAVLLFPCALWLTSRCHAQASDYYFNETVFVEGTLTKSTDTRQLIWQLLFTARPENSQARINVTQQTGGVFVTLGEELAFPADRPSIQRLTVSGSNPTSSVADLIFTYSSDDSVQSYFSMMLPLSGEASTYSNSIGPQCDSALAPNASSVLFNGNAAGLTITDDGQMIYERVGARAAEMQPVSKLNEWPIVLEIENHPVEGYSYVRVMSDGSDVVQQCGFAVVFSEQAGQVFTIAGSETGTYLEIDSVMVEFWYNDTSAPTTSPTSDPTTEPTTPTAQPTSTPSQTPTGAPSNDPTTDPTDSPTTEPTAEDNVAEKESSDDGLAIGLGVAGGVVALLIIGAVVYYLVVMKKK